MISETISHCRILEKLGDGGIGGSSGRISSQIGRFNTPLR